MKITAFLLLICITTMVSNQSNCKRKSLKGAKNNANTIVQPNKSASEKADGDSINKSPSPASTPRTNSDYELSAKEVARLAMPSVVLIVSNNGNYASQGSGFFIKPGVVITNFHVVDDLNGEIEVEFWSGSESKHFGIAEVVAYDEDSDLAILDVPAARNIGVQTLSLINENETVEIGETVYALGNPEGLERTFSPGIVSAQIRSSDKLARVQISAPISHGSSGGPIINSKGKVIGVAVSTMEEGQNLNFAVPAALVYSIMKNQNSPSQ